MFLTHCWPPSYFKMAEALPADFGVKKVYHFHDKIHHFFVDEEQKHIFVLASGEEIDNRVRNSAKTDKDLEGSNALFNVGNGSVKDDSIEAKKLIMERDYDALQKEKCGVICVPKVFIYKNPQILDPEKIDQVIEANAKEEYSAELEKRKPKPKGAEGKDKK